MDEIPRPVDAAPMPATTFRRLGLVVIDFCSSTANFLQAPSWLPRYHIPAIDEGLITVAGS